MTNQTLQLTDHLCFALYNANRLANQFYKKSLASLDLTYTQYLVLLALWEKDRQSLYQLGQRLDLASNTLTPLLKRLEEKGYIERQRSASDKRQLLITLTPKGQTLQPSTHQLITDDLALLESEDVQQLENTLIQLQKLELVLQKLNQ